MRALEERPTRTRKKETKRGAKTKEGRLDLTGKRIRKEGINGWGG